MKKAVLFIFLQISLLTRTIAVTTKFPNNFLFGVGSSSYQIEGGWNDDGKGENIWDHYVHNLTHKIKNKSTGDIACDSYHKYLEDVNMIKNLGAHIYKFSISWSRILPSGFVNEVNPSGVHYYMTLIKALKQNGIEPYVNIYHWDLPQKLQELGGWSNPILVDYFANYARLLFTLFGNDVKNWITFNEPFRICTPGYGLGTFAPNVASNGIGDYLCGHTILKAHAKAYHIYDQEFRPIQQGRVSIVFDVMWYEPNDANRLNQEAAERRMEFELGWFANPIFHPDGNYPQVMIDRISKRSQQEGFAASRLPVFTPQEINYIKRTSDFLGLNIYTSSKATWSKDYPIGTASRESDISVNIFQESSWNNSASTWLQVTPWEIRKLLKRIDVKYGHPEILIITENGFSDNGELIDDKRIDYLVSYLNETLQAIYEDGIKITGYTVWSLMDSFEWLDGYT